MGAKRKFKRLYNEFMKVSIISFGKFHSFDLARELSNYYKVNLFSTYPFFVAKKYYIKKNNFYSFFLLQVLDRFTFRFFSSLFKIIYAFSLTLIIPKKQDIYIFWSDIPTFLIKSVKTKSPNSIIILERGSSHIVHQYNLLKKEYDTLKEKLIFPSKNILTELKNYEVADYISIPSKFALDSFLSFNFPKEKLFLNPYGSDLSKFYPKKINKNQKFTLITCGLASIQKGFHYMLDAHRYIDGDFLHIHVGNLDSPFKQNYRDYENLKVINSVSHDLLVDYYNQADVLIIPSIQDGFGMTILEAMACGLPIISSSNTGFPTIKTNGKDCGFIIEIRSPQQIAEKVNYLKKNKNFLKKLSFNSIDTIKSGGYTWKDYGLRYSNFISSKK